MYLYNVNNASNQGEVRAKPRPNIIGITGIANLTVEINKPDSQAARRPFPMQLRQQAKSSNSAKLL